MTAGTFVWALVKAFAVGGAICLLGQLLFDAANLTPAVTMSLLVSAGAIAGGLGWYERLADWAGFGAQLPISSFGNILAQGALSGAAADGWRGLFAGMLQPASVGIVTTIAAGFAVALLFRPRS